MKINSYNKQQYIDIKEQNGIANKNKLNKEEEKKMNTHTSEDTLEISKNLKQLNLIRMKIEDAFYDDPNILKKVAEKILYTIDSKV